MNNYKPLFLIDPDIVFLNHGSFGACPRPVFEAYQKWQTTLEKQPVEFLGRRAAELLSDARQSLAEYLVTGSDEVVFFPNPTTAVNMVARNFARPISSAAAEADRRFFLCEGDEILATDHEYGTLNRTWSYICKLTDARFINAPFPLPLEEDSVFLERLWSHVNERTKLIFISQITSPTALEFPVAEICRRARQEGILTLIDGAHAPGQVPLDLNSLRADIYVGACHKWMCAPKGSAFLYARKEICHNLDPLVVSWGYESDQPTKSHFIDYHEWQGTRDLAAFLSVSAAIQFQVEHNWGHLQANCHSLALKTRQQINSFLDEMPMCSDEKIHQMFAIRLPEHTDPNLLKETLINQYKIEIPVMEWNNQQLLRVSIQAYNDEEDTNKLLTALKRLI